MLHNVTRTSAAVCANFSTRINAGVNACVHVVADDRAELSSSCVDQLAIDHRTMIGSIVTEVGGNGASAKIDFFADDRVADIRQVTDGRV